MSKANEILVVVNSEIHTMKTNDPRYSKLITGRPYPMHGMNVRVHSALIKEAYDNEGMDINQLAQAMKLHELRVDMTSFLWANAMFFAVLGAIFFAFVSLFSLNPVGLMIALVLGYLGMWIPKNKFRTVQCMYERKILKEIKKMS